MSELFLEKTYGRKLVHAYIALTWAQKVAKRYEAEQSGDVALHPLVTILDSTAKLLEEILQDASPSEGPSEGPSETMMIRSQLSPCSEMIM